MVAYHMSQNMQFLLGLIFTHPSQDVQYSESSLEAKGTDSFSKVPHVSGTR